MYLALTGQAFCASEAPTDECTFLSSGVTFSFFWKTQGEQSRPAPYAYGGQVVSDGFKVCSSDGKGSVELYTRDNSMTWKATFNPPGKCVAPTGTSVSLSDDGTRKESLWHRAPSCW